jgi:AbrB family looped-hinge helix DNA binding protein
MEEFVKMSPKGQLVVPQDIREKEGFKPGDRFIAIRVSEGIVFKKIELPDIKKIKKQVEESYK